MGKALTALGHLSAAGLILLVVAVVLSTVLTQAFQFESIRLLEGYWGPGGLWTRIADRRCERHLDRRDDIYKRLDETTTAAFEQASAQMLAEGVPPRVVAAYSRVLRKETTAEQLPATQRRDVERFPWRVYAPIRLLRRIESLDVASQRFPIDDLAVRPTRLGNMLRSYEDPLADEIGQPIEGFVQELFHRLPVVIQVDHDQLRSRLDLYCSLVLVFSLIGLLSTGLLATVSTWREALIAGAVGVALMWLSYRAAVTSARAYGTYLDSLTQFAPPRNPTPTR